MFEKWRKPGRAKNISSFIIFGLICLVFVFIGVPVSQMSNLGGAALVVNNKVISWSEYQNYLMVLEQQASEQSGGGIEAERQEKLKQQAVNDLLNIELMAQTAHKIGVTISKKAVQDKIVEFPFFKEEGRFIHSKYHAFLEARRFSASYYEDLIRREIQRARLQNIFNITVRASAEERKKKQQLGKFMIQVSYIQFPSGSLKPEEFNNINTVVKAGDMDLFSEIVKERNWEWNKTDSFDLSRTSLPGLESEKILFDKVFQSLPDTGMIKNIIGVRDQSFILKVDHFTVVKSEKSDAQIADFLPDHFFTNRLLSQVTFFSWIRSARSSAKLKINPRLQGTVQP